MHSNSWSLSIVYLGSRTASWVPSDAFVEESNGGLTETLHQERFLRNLLPSALSSHPQVSR